MRNQELIETIENKGVENIRFSVPMRPINDFGIVRFTSTSDEPVKVECKINEEHYKLKDRYKVGLESLAPGYGREDFYLSDLASLIERGYIQILS